MEPLDDRLIRKLLTILRHAGGQQRLFASATSSGIAVTDGSWLVEWPDELVDMDGDRLKNLWFARKNAGNLPESLDDRCWRTRLLPSKQFIEYERVRLTEEEQEYYRNDHYARKKVMPDEPLVVAYAHLYDRLYFSKNYHLAFSLIFPMRDYKVYIPERDANSTIPLLCPFFEGIPAGAMVSMAKPNFREEVEYENEDTEFGPGSSSREEEAQYAMACGSG